MTDGRAFTTDLRAAVGRGDRDALARVLMADSLRLSKRIANRLRLNPFADFSTDDVLQEVFVDVFRGIDSFDRENLEAWQGWLNKITDNRLAAMLRQRSRKKRGGELRPLRHAPNDTADSMIQLVALLADESGVTPSRNVTRDEMIQAVQVAIAALPDDQRVAIHQYFLDERSLGSTAEALDKTDAAVRGLLHRAKKNLREILGHSTTWFVKR